MKKSDLKVGDIIKTRDGKYLVILSNDCSKDGLGAFSSKTYGCHCYMSEYEEDLTCKNKMRNDKDIIAVYKGSEPAKKYAFRAIDIIINNESDEYDKKFLEQIPWDWERPEPIKEMTMEELEKHFGCKVKIVNAE